MAHQRRNITVVYSIPEGDDGKLETNYMDVTVVAGAHNTKAQCRSLQEAHERVQRIMKEHLDRNEV